MKSASAAVAAKSHGRLARHAMTRDVVTVDENTPLHTIADIFETRRIKRVPVMRENQIVGIVSRANLLHALVAGGVTEGERPSDD